MTTGTAWQPGALIPATMLSVADVAAIKAALTPSQIVGLTAHAEARSRFVKNRGWVSNPLEAMVDIIEVIDYRSRRPRWAPVGHKGVCLFPAAFSCWMKSGGLENYLALFERAQRLLAGSPPSSVLANCIAAAERCVGGALAHTLPADTCHYYAEWMPTPPAWAFEDPKTRTRPRTLVAHRWGHVFFAQVP